MPAVKAKAQVQVEINDELYTIKFPFEAQVAISEALGVDEIEKLPSLLRTMNPRTIAIMISAGLVGKEFSAEDLMTADVPSFQATIAITKAMNLAVWGLENGPAEGKD